MSRPIEFNGYEDVLEMFRGYPKAFTLGMRKFLFREKRAFIGNKKGVKGTFRRSLANKKRKYRKPGTNWNSGLGAVFTGNMSNREQLDNMTMHMGVDERNWKKIPLLQLLSKGGTVRAKNKWLMLPMYKNLDSIGLLGRYGSGSNAKRNWTKWRKDNSHYLQSFYSRGRFLVFGDMDTAHMRGSHRNRHLGKLNRKLLFVGVPSVSIKQQFDFIKSANKRFANIGARADKAVDRIVTAIEKGKEDTLG